MTKYRSDEEIEDDFNRTGTDEKKLKCGMLTVELLLNIREQNERIIELLHDIVKKDKSKLNNATSSKTGMIDGGNNVTLSSHCNHYGTYIVGSCLQDILKIS